MGPCISWQAFEVGDEVVQQFLDNGFPQSVLGVLRHAGVNDVSAKPHIDLCAANALWLFETLGVPLEHIQISGICTYANYDTFFLCSSIRNSIWSDFYGHLQKVNHGIA